MLLWLCRSICIFANAIKSQKWNYWIKGAGIFICNCDGSCQIAPHKGHTRALSLAMCEKTCSSQLCHQEFVIKVWGFAGFLGLKKSYLCIVVTCIFLMSEVKQIFMLQWYSFFSVFIDYLFKYFAHFSGEIDLFWGTA